ncbi:MAG: hypothetical protein IH872_05655 [Chloroflexi bacterium]|nr:hypothetical protein [Chloroflexota bacterium]
MAHAEYLRQEGGDDLEVERIKSDWRQMDLSEAERVMLEWVEKLTVAPSTCNRSDIDAMRAVGWTDRDVLDIAQVCAYFNMRVRIVDGLGLDVDEWQIARAKAGAENAAKLASERGVEMPSDPWGVR